MSAAPILPLHHRHVAHSVSTNSELIDALQSGQLDNQARHLLTADTQSGGRGQHGRSWQSPQGNVYLSLYHPLSIPLGGILSLIIGSQLAAMPIIQTINAARASDAPKIGVKWANDLGFYQKEPDASTGLYYFQKLAGILIEPVWCARQLVGIVIGVGLNVQTTPQLTTRTAEGMSYHAISLQDIINDLPPHSASIAPPELPELYTQIANALTQAVAQFAALSGDTAQTTEQAILREFAAADVLCGKTLRISESAQFAQQTRIGRADGIDTQGCLRLVQPDGALISLFTGRIDVIDPNADKDAHALA